jgi:Integrase core domain
VLAAFRQTVADQGIPASVLSDNGMVFTTRFSGGRAGRDTLNGFQAELRRLGVIEKHSRPNHPTTCGKVERFQQTLKKWLRAQPQQPQTIAELQALCDQFVTYYNNRRPHRSLGRRTPAAAYQARPKAAPPATAEAAPQARVRRDVVDSDGKLTLRHAGRLHHIGMSRTHARTPVLMLINGLDIRIIHATTGELLRELQLNPAVDYQAQGVRKPRPKPSKGFKVFPMSCDITTLDGTPIRPHVRAPPSLSPGIATA